MDEDYRNIGTGMKGLGETLKKAGIEDSLAGWNKAVGVTRGRGFEKALEEMTRDVQEHPRRSVHVSESDLSKLLYNEDSEHVLWCRNCKQGLRFHFIDIQAMTEFLVFEDKDGFLWRAAASVGPVDVFPRILMGRYAPYCGVCKADQGLNYQYVAEGMIKGDLTPQMWSKIALKLTEVEEKKNERRTRTGTAKDGTEYTITATPEMPEEDDEEVIIRPAKSKKRP